MLARSRLVRTSSRRKRLVARTFDALEQRRLMTIVTVTNTADSGLGSLRDAINQVNLDSIGPNQIDFNIPGAGAHTIAPVSSLPAITATVLIDGYSQPGSKPNDLAIGDDAVIGIVLDGSGAGNTASGLTVNADAVTIRGLAIGHFMIDGIAASAHTGLVIAGNFIGTNVRGNDTSPNIYAGVQFSGVTASTIGGTSVADRNVISGNVLQGIGLFAFGTGTPTGSDNDVIQNNYIGTDANGLSALGNSESSGIVIRNSSSIVIGGSSVATRNIISGNGGFGGVLITGSLVENIVVSGNYIGVGANGTTVVRNDSYGVGVFQAGTPGNDFAPIIGISGNVISGNDGPGIEVTESRALIRGNLIGTDANDTKALGNQDAGILVSLDKGSSIGGTAPGDGNVIAFSGTLYYRAGIEEFSPATAVIRANSIFGNAHLGIDILNDIFNDDGVTPNHPPKSPTDPNRFPNYPVISQAISNGEGTHVLGSFDGTENSLTTLDFFSNPAADPSGFGQGQVYLGSISFTTDANGHADFTADLPVVPPGQFLTATASSFATSEFSRAVAVMQAAPKLTLAVTGSPDPVAVADVLTYTVTVTNVGTSAASGVFLRDGLSPDVVITDESAASIRGQGGTFTPNPDGGATINLPAATITAGATETLVFQVRPRVAGDIPNTATANYFVTDEPVFLAQSITTKSIDSFVVLNNHDSGFGSLRQAILNANANPGVDTITFNLPPSQLSIRPLSALPAVTDPTVIDASTQPGFAGTPIVDVNGVNRVPSANTEIDGLVITAGGSTVRGLVVDGFEENGIVLQGGSGSRIVDTEARNNGDTGILVRGSSNNTIGGTTEADRVVASANGAIGIQINGGSARNLIEGSDIGTDATGRAALGNGRDGVFIDRSPNNTVGGSAPGAANVVAYSDQVGIHIFGASASGNLVTGNLVGVTRGGRRPGNGRDGILVYDAPKTTIGGSAAGAGNFIGGKERVGIQIAGRSAVGEVILGNTVRSAAGAIGISNENRARNKHGFRIDLLDAHGRGARNAAIAAAHHHNPANTVRFLRVNVSARRGEVFEA